MQRAEGASGDDIRFMARALQLAERGLYTTDPNPRVGCVLVDGRQIVGEGWHRRVGGPHAEIEALRAAGGRAKGATAYVTLEPCCHHGKTPPCTDALIAAGVSRVVAAVEDPNPRVGGKGLALLREAGIATECGVLAAAAEDLNRGFFARMRLGRPYVRSKLACSLDGRTALSSGESKWITGDAARRDGHRFRARSSVILTGIGTVLADDPLMTARLPDDEDLVQPARAVLDSTLRMPPDARLLRQSGHTLVMTRSNDEMRTDALRAAGADVVAMSSEWRGAGVNLAEALQVLADREFNEVWVEAGARLNGALLDQGLVDEWILYIAPCALGNTARGLWNIAGLDRIADRHRFAFTDVRQIGGDLRIRLAPARP
ncbi:MAG: bifunctional diaminohydroxyphosphoribosylaminopyrimidine deaminase/5-amino-6-(5-phosphoribosylamino)uracil reductase RibD [Methylotetracoccus sp.]